MANTVGFEVKGKDNGGKKVLADTEKGVNDVAKAIKAVPNKTIDIKADDKATKVIKDVDGKKIADKNVDIKADDNASSKIDHITKQKPAPIIVPVEVQTEGAGKDIATKFRSVGEASAGLFGSGLISGLAAANLSGSMADIIGSSLEAAANKKKIKIDLQNQMGITPEAAKNYGDRVGASYAEGLGSSQDQISASYSNLSSAVKNWSGLTVTAQDKIAKGAVKVSQAFNVDVADAIKAAGSAVNSGLVPDWNSAFDLISTGFQTLGPAGDDFLETLGEYSGLFKQVGFNGNEMLGLLQQGLQAGARDTDYIADAWKEFGIRIIDNSDSTKQALKDLHLNAAKIPEAIAQGGPAAEAAIGKVIDSIKKIKDPIKQNEIGVALFGTQWEDTFRRVINSTDLGAAKMTEFTGATDKLVSASDSQAEKFSRRWERGLERFGEGFATGANKVGEFVDSVVGGVDSLTTGTGILTLYGVEADKAAGKVGGLKTVIDSIVTKTVKIAADTQEAAKIDEVRSKLKGLPPNTAVKVQGMTAEAEAQLNGLGYKVTHMPNGWVSVQAQTSAAQKNIDDFIWYNNQRKIGIPVVVTTPKTGPVRNQSGGMVAKASGGPVAAVSAAAGGARTGAIMVNEMGLETATLPNRDVVTLPTGSSVNPNAGNAGTPMEVVISWDFSGMESELGRVIVKALRGARRGSGKTLDEFLKG
jgi:phage-related minor tail protein